MSDKTYILNYSYEDLQRYASGQMPAAEMRRMEMESLKDPFLADALEGVMQADENKASADIHFIRERLNSLKRSSEKNIAFTWWKIAAAVILIAGAGIISYSLLNSSKENRLAKTENTILK